MRRKTLALLLIATMLLALCALPAARAAGPYTAALCAANEHVLFSFKAGSKTLSICVSDDPDYIVYRYGTKDSDFGRTARQREVIEKIFLKLSKMTALDLMSLVLQNASSVYTNLSVSQLAGFAPVLISMKDAKTSELRLPIDGAYTSKTISGMSVLVPDRQKNMDALMKFLEDAKQ